MGRSRQWSAPGNSEVFLDGAPASQGNVRGGIQENGPAIEQIGEFSVVTNAFNAEYGRTGSWFTSIVIRSGTNQLHGSVYDYFANDALNARSFFQAQRNIVRQHEGGFTLGGPIYIPKVYDGRNKTDFQVLGLSLLQGRDFDADDGLPGKGGVIVGEGFETSSIRARVPSANNCAYSIATANRKPG